eukprot:8368814-Pyramimonas_sp.AAC.1
MGENIPIAGTNHRRGERIYPSWAPITEEEREYKGVTRLDIVIARSSRMGMAECCMNAAHLTGEEARHCHCEVLTNGHGDRNGAKGRPDRGFIAVLCKHSVQTGRAGR